MYFRAQSVNNVSPHRAVLPSHVSLDPEEGGRIFRVSCLIARLARNLRRRTHFFRALSGQRAAELSNGRYMALSTLSNSYTLSPL